MEISGPLNLTPASRPPPTYETLRRRDVEQQTPRAFPAVSVPMPALSMPLPLPRPQPSALPVPRPQAQAQPLQSLPPPQFTRVISTPKKDMSLWKLSREFNDVDDAYHHQQQQQPPPEIQLYQQELQGQPAPTEHTYQYPRGDPFQASMAAQQRETVPIGYDPSYGAPAGMGPPAQEGVPTTSQTGQPWGAQGALPPPHGGAPLQRLGAIPPPPPPPPPQASAGAEEGGYSPDWITAEAPNSLTDGAFYDGDADRGDMMHAQAYTYGAPGAAEGEEGAGDQGDQGDFERPRQVPYDHRQTRVVLREDVDFYMALLGGQDPPPASDDAQSLVRREEEGRRRSREVEAGRSTARREEELQDTQGDLAFWMSLMEK